MGKIINKQFKSAKAALAILIYFVVCSGASAEGKIIQEEKIDFEKCLKLITTSQDKLSIAPKINDVSGKNRIAVFMLMDGTLTIECDGEEGNVTVSTNTN